MPVVLVGGGLQGGRSAQVNLNFFDPSLDLGLINTIKGGNGFGPRGGTPTGDFWGNLNSDGYPTAIAAGTTNWTLFTSAYLLEANSTFTGSISGNTLTVPGSVTGTPLHIGQTIMGSTTTAATRITAGSGTSWTVSGSPQTVGSATLTAYIPWVFEWTGNAAASDGDSFAAGVSVPSGITFPFPFSQKVSSNRYEYNVTTSGANPVGTVFSVEIVINVVASTPSNMRFYRQDQEALLNAGQVAAPHFVSYYGGYGRLRFMNWQQTNGSSYAQWTNRSLASNVCYDNMPSTNAYCGLATQSKNDYTCPNTLAGNPVAWTQGMMVQASITNNPAACTFTGKIDNGSGSAGNTLTVSTVQQGALAIGQSIRAMLNNGSVQICTITAGSGTSWTVGGSAQLTSSSLQMLTYTGVTGFATGATTTVTAPNHGFSNGDVIFFPAGEIISTGGTGIDVNLFGQFYTVASAAANTFVLSGINSTGWGTYSSGGIVAYQVRFKTSTLPFKQVVTSIVGSFFEGGQLDSINSVNNIVNLIYDADFDKLLYNSNPKRGLPIDVACKIANDCNVNPWICIPHLAAADAGGAFESQMATLIKSTLNSNLKWCCELSNEVWNTAGGFDQTNFAQAKGILLWPASFAADNSGTRSIYDWYGWRFYNMMLNVNTVYSGATSQLVKIFGVKTDFNNTTFQNYRFQAPDTGVAAFPITQAQEICIAPYIEPDRISTPQASTIANFVSGGAGIALAFADLDAAFNCNFANYTAGISNGSGGAGTILNVTAIVAGTVIAVGQPVNFGGVAANTFITALGTGTGGIGTYTVNNSQLVAPGANFLSTTSFTSGVHGTLHVTVFPFWQTTCAANSVTLSMYEGGWGVFPSADANPGTNQTNLFIAYQASTNYQTILAAVLADYKSFGGTFGSQFCITSGSPTANGMFGLAYPAATGQAAIFNPAPLPAKTAFDAYNAS